MTANGELVELKGRGPDLQGCRLEPLAGQELPYRLSRLRRRLLNSPVSASRMACFSFDRTSALLLPEKLCRRPPIET